MIGASVSLNPEKLMVNLVCMATPLSGDIDIVPPDGGLFN